MERPCPKCGQHRWTGPKWEQERWVEHEFQSQKISDECLRYVCPCGYTMTTPCKDARGN